MIPYARIASWRCLIIFLVDEFIQFIGSVKVEADACSF